MKSNGKLGAGLLAAALLAAAVPAYADIDQLCLKQCVSSGRNSADCLNDCSYGAPEMPLGTAAPMQAPANPSKFGTSHNILAAPVPVGTQVVLPQKAPPKPQPEKDYVCLTQCLHNGDAYQLCDRRCTRAPCAPGSLDCSDVPRVLNGQVIDAPNGNNPGVLPAQ